MKANPKIIIIGAGPCGLGAGWRLHELGYKNYQIYEKESYVGGLATSFRDEQGFTWDVGGHVLHSHYAYFDRMFKTVMHGDFYTHERESWVWMFNRFIPYPLQNNIRHLPKKILYECLAGLKKSRAETSRDIHTFADWILASFGEGLAKYFLLPYNRKVWAYPPEKMNYQWVGDRVATVDIEKIERNIGEKKDDISWGPNALFHFPKNGGTGEIWKRVGHFIKENIIQDKRIIRINAKKKIVYFSDDTLDHYDALLTTMPLDQTVRLINETKELLPRSALHHSSVTIVGIGIQGETPKLLQTKCWMYFPEKIAPFFRATVFSNYSHFNAPKGAWSLMTEISSSRYVPLATTDMGNIVTDALKTIGLLTKSDRVVDRWIHTSPYGYPTPTLKRDTYLSYVLPMLETYDIYSRGRFGAWKYEVSNQDHTCMQGVEWVNRILFGESEITLNNPSGVNGRTT